MSGRPINRTLRDVCVVFIPPISTMDETFEYLSAAGFKLL